MTTSHLHFSYHAYKMLSMARSTGKTGIKIDGEYLSHLIFADDIELIAKSTSELQKMIQDIHETSKPVGLNMHLGKTKVMCNPAVNKTDINIK